MNTLTKFKPLLLAATLAALAALAGCSATSDHNGKVDHGDGVETPDPLLQETDGKQVQYGDKNYGLAADAKDHDEQVEPDLLEQDLANGRKATIQQEQTQTAQQSSAPAKQKSKAKAKKKPMTEAERRKRDSALEVEDPLLGEVDPA